MYTSFCLSMKIVSTFLYLHLFILTVSGNRYEVLDPARRYVNSANSDQGYCLFVILFLLIDFVVLKI